jgi:hypothetical protein
MTVATIPGGIVPFRFNCRLSTADLGACNLRVSILEFACHRTGKFRTHGPLQPKAHDAKMGSEAETVPPIPVSKPVAQDTG